MKEVPFEQLSKEIQNILVASQEGKVNVMRDGVLYAMIIGMENKDAEDFGYMTSPEFWRMIAERRRETNMIPFEKVKAGLFPAKKSKKTKPARRKPIRR